MNGTIRAEEAGFQDFKVNDKYHFIDPENGVQNQNLEFVRVSEYSILINSTSLQAHFTEFMRRKETDDSFFNNIKIFLHLIEGNKTVSFIFEWVN